eukprot:CAMPEP_0170545560 /NCGR_PEP_ID=MMETSP0211-20121228/3952_1 /TAXON_ID=311385 /ORGANISM="Pseudokeronopsis sp., Strain OXSARD2" /LENGTH=121 /DNA_ID=CAMNT_0010849543 /DNA_START=654 /DNA_END=1019 /DNA_ORIENTATION=+
MPPTKTSIFVFNSDEMDETLRLQELQVKGTSTKKLSDYGVKNGSIIILKQFLDGNTVANVYNDIAKCLGEPATKLNKGQVVINDSYFGESEMKEYSSIKKRQGTPKAKNKAKINPLDPFSF